MVLVGLWSASLYEERNFIIDAFECLDMSIGLVTGLRAATISANAVFLRSLAGRETGIYPRLSNMAANGVLDVP
jgi:hypothetical protein